MYNPFSWVKSLTRIVLYYGIALLLGWFFDQLLLAVACASTLLVIINYYHLLASMRDKASNCSTKLCMRVD